MIQFLKFGIVGILNTLINIGVYIILVSLGFNYILSNIIGYTFGLLNSFFWNKNWVFKTNRNSKYLFLKFLLINIITLGINTLILFLLVNNLHFNLILSQIVATGIGMVFNFILNKYWTFMEKENSSII